MTFFKDTDLKIYAIQLRNEGRTTLQNGKNGTKGVFTLLFKSASSVEALMMTLKKFTSLAHCSPKLV